MLFQVPSTKRSAYYAFIKYIDSILDLELFKSPDRVQGISGPRHCGKTILLQQIYNNYADISFYKEYGDNEDYLTLYDDVLESQKKIVIIDEICKASNVSQIKFCSDVKKLQNAGRIVLYTGSVSGVLQSLCDSIGRGTVFDIGTFSYLEFLLWNADDFSDNPFILTLENLESLSSNELFIRYLYFLKDNIYKTNYITQVIFDTCVSVRNRYRTSFNISKEDLLKIIRYLAVQQNNITESSMPDIKKYGQIDVFIDKILQQINMEYQTLSKDVKTTGIELLINSDLIKESIDHNRRKIYLFTYPWILTEYFYNIKGVAIFNEIKPVEDIWVEAILLRQMWNIFLNCAKWQEAGVGEVDIVYYTFASEPMAIEVKNAPYHNAIKSQKSAKNFALSIGVSKYAFTYSDGEPEVKSTDTYSISNHKLMLLLELVNLYNNIFQILNLSNSVEISPTDISDLEVKLSKVMPFMTDNKSKTNLFS